MKKIILGALCALGLFSTANAQDTFRKNDNVLNVGIGLSTENLTVSLPPLSATYERCVADGIIENGSLGIGVQAEVLAYKGAGVALFAGPRLAFHYEFTENLDTYIGVQAGLAFASSRASFGVDGVLGARYYLGEKWGVFGELGTGLSTFKLGATFRM
ncbi:MAG: hypothetical protein SPK09_08600 [Porphyromonas sp.]|nr:hypothetical protein [Porphyromonas sp.]